MLGPWSTSPWPLLLNNKEYQVTFITDWTVSCAGFFRPILRRYGGIEESMYRALNVCILGLHVYACMLHETARMHCMYAEAARMHACILPYACVACNF